MQNAANIVAIMLRILHLPCRHSAFLLCPAVKNYWHCLVLFRSFYRHRKNSRNDDSPRKVPSFDRKIDP